MAADELIYMTRWHNGKKTYTPFSEGELARRHVAMQARVLDAGIDAGLFTSYHNTCYFSGFLYCKFGLRYGAVLTRDSVTTLSVAIDGGQLWQRSVSDNVT